MIFALLIAVVLSLSAVSATDVSAVDGDVLSIDDSISDVSLEDVSTGEATDDLGSVDTSTEETIDTDSVSANAKADENTLTSNAVGDGEGSSWYVDSNVETTGDGSQASPFKTIKEAINASNGNGTIYLASGIYNSTDDRGFNFKNDENLAIIGAGSDTTIIDMLSSDRFASSDGESLYLANLTFTNPSSGSYGSMIWSACNLTVENCVFKNGYSSYSGGALFLQANSTIRDCIFENNVAMQYGGAIQVDVGSYSIKDIVNVLIDGCSFINNSFRSNSGSGGSIDVYGWRNYANVRNTPNLIVNNCNFSESYKTIAIRDAGNLSLFNCIFTNITRPPDITSQYGCIIYLYGNYNTTIDSCIFENNTLEQGKLIYTELYSPGVGNLTVINSRFVNNVHNMYNATILSSANDNITLQNNTCEGVFLSLGNNTSANPNYSVKSEVNVIVLDNSTIDVNDTTVILYATLTDDNNNLIALGSNGIGLYLNETQIASNLRFYGGYASYSFKKPINGIYVVNYLIDPNKFSNVNYKTGVINYYPTLENIDIYVSTTGSDETGNGTEANPFKTVEKGLDIASTVFSATVYIKGGTYEFSSHKDIDTAGGDLNIIGYDGDVIIDMGNNTAFCSISNNSNALISNINFINGFSQNAQIINSNGNLTVRNCNFSNNKGASTTIRGANIIDSCSFSNNTQVSGSNGIDLMNCRYIVNSTFYGVQDSNKNSISSSTYMTIENSKFYNNSFIRYSDSGMSCIINSCEFNNPDVTSIVIGVGAATINNCTFSNSSKANIQLSGRRTTANITNCKFINNTGVSTQSSIYDNDIKELYLENNTVLDNEAPYLFAQLSLTTSSITSPVTIVVLNNETVEVESYGATLKAKLFDDNGNPILLSQLSFAFNGETVQGSIDGDDIVGKYLQLCNGTYLVSASSSYLQHFTVKTGVLVITPLMNKELYVSTAGSDETGDGTEANPYATLKRAVDDAKAYNNTIHIAEGVYSIDSALDINTATAILNIVGNGENTIFDMNNTVNFISTLSASSIVEIRNLTLANGKSPSNEKGGFITTAGNLTIYNVNFINSTAYMGGAIINRGNLTIADSYFDNTVASDMAGAIYSENILYVLNTIFNKTSAEYFGTIYSESYLYIKNNTFIDTSGEMGENIFAWGTIDGGVVLTVMDNETWDISTSSITLNASVVDDNNYPIYLYDIPVSFYIDGFKVASAYIEGDVVTTTTNIKVNGVHTVSATLSGAEELMVKNATLNLNVPGVLHDIYISTDGDDVNGDGSSQNPYATFSKAFSVAESFGSVIHVMSNYSITQQITVSDLVDITVLGENSDINFKDCQNTVFYINSNVTMNFVDIKFSENSNGQYKFFQVNQWANLNLINCTFENNIISNNGLAWFIFGNNANELNLINCKIINNEITKRTSTSYGILIAGVCNSRFINCTFANNTIESADNESRTDVSLISLYNTQAWTGSGWSYKDTNYNSLIENCIFENNTGGVITSKLDLTIDNCSFTNNNGRFLIDSAALSDLGYGSSNYKLAIKDSRFEENIANRLIVSDGGGRNLGSTIVNSTFDSNKVIILIDSNSTAYISENIFNNNSGDALLKSSRGVNTIFNNQLDLSNIAYVNLSSQAKINGSSYYLIVNDNGTYDVLGNTLILYSKLVDDEGNIINGEFSVDYALNDETIVNGYNVDNYTIKTGLDGEVLASAITAVVYNSNDLTVKTALFNITQIENRVIYVDILGSDETGDGSEENPYASLARAMQDVVASNNIIYIQPGVYDGMGMGTELFKLMDNQTLEIIGLSNEVDKVIIKGLNNSFIRVSYNTEKVSADKFTMKNIDFVDVNITNGMSIIDLYYVDVVEISDINVENCSVRESFLKDNLCNVKLSNINVSNLNCTSLVGSSSINNAYKDTNLEIFDSIFENIRSNYVINSQKTNIVNSVFDNIYASSYALGNMPEFKCNNSIFNNISGPWLFNLGNFQDVNDQISNTVISNCNINNYLINGYNRNITIYNSVFASNTCQKMINHNDPANKLFIDDNWWGYNITSDELFAQTGRIVDNWIVADVTANDSDIAIGDVVKFDIVLKLNDGSELTDILPARIVQAIAENTVFDPESVEIVDNAATITGTVAGTGDITISIDNQDFVFAVKGYTVYLTVDNLAINVGDNATVTVTLKDDNGALAEREITITVDGVDYTATTDADGIATVEIEGLTKGNYIATASFAGDDLYDSATGAGLIMVSDAILTVDVPAVDYGSPVTVNVGLVDSEDNPLSGLVIVNINGEDYNVLVNDGVGTLTIPVELDAGDYTVNAKLIGEDNAIASAEFTVNKLSSEMTVTVNNITHGEPITINLELADKTISGLAIVTVNEIDYAIEIVDGLASKTINALLDGGSYDVIAKFIGDNYDIADAATSFTVNASSDTQLDAVVNDHSLDITLTDGSGNGINGAVNVTIDDVTTEVPIVNGKASVAIPDGDHTVAVDYLGDANNGPVSINKEVTVVPNIIDTVVNVAVNNIDYGEIATIDFTVTDIEGNSISGKLNVSVNDIVKEVDVIEGSASVSIENLTSGNYVVIANYIANDNYAESVGIGKFTVNKLGTTIEYSDMTTTAVDVDTDGRAGENFTVTLKDSNGKPLANKDVLFGFNGKIYEKVTDENGQAQLQINLKRADIYTFAVSFLGDDNYNGSFVVAKITVNKQKGSLTVPNKNYKASAKTKTLTATFKSASGKVVAGKKVTFTVNGKTYSATTDAKGVASVNVSLTSKKTYSFTAKFAGDNTYAAITKTAKVTIK